MKLFLKLFCPVSAVWGSCALSVWMRMARAWERPARMQNHDLRRAAAWTDGWMGSGPCLFLPNLCCNLGRTTAKTVFQHLCLRSTGWRGMAECGQGKDEKTKNAQSMKERGEKAVCFLSLGLLLSLSLGLGCDCGAVPAVRGAACLDVALPGQRRQQTPQGPGARVRSETGATVVRVAACCAVLRRVAPHLSHPLLVCRTEILSGKLVKALA